MSLHRTFLAISAASVSSLLVGCAHEKPRVDTLETHAADVRMAKNQRVNVAGDIRNVCKIEEPEGTPKFDFDSADLSDGDRDILTQVARCLTTGALKNRSVALVGRADSRGESEYNMVLGDYRAASVSEYLAGLGVDKKNMLETSRGELDATGNDEAGWQIDRRVDIALTK